MARCLSVAVTTMTLLLAGCALHHRTPPPRPTIDELIHESMARSMELHRYEVEQINEQVIYDAPVGGEFGAVMEGDSVLVGPTESIPAGEAFYEDDSYFDADADQEEARITEEFVETPVAEVLGILAEEAGVDLVMADDINGAVNARLEDMTLDRAIETVLMPHGLHYARQGDRIIVASDDPESPLFPYVSERADYCPMHLDAETLYESVPENQKKFVDVIGSTNMLVVEAPKLIVDEILDRLSSIDQPIPQVVLEAIICVVSPDSGFQFGLDWQHAVELNGQNALRFGATGLALASNFSRAGADHIFSDFAHTSSFVKLLSENGYLTIRASPSVMAEDNKPAHINIGRETFFSITPQAIGSNDTFFSFQQNIQTVESGISLDITPRIRGDAVTVKIEKAEVSEDIRNANTELAVNPFPIINRRSVSTTVHVKDGKTIVIGGLVQRETIDRVNKVPGFSRIPLLGYLFQTTQRQTRDAEVLIFLSPRIVVPPPVSH